MISRDKVVEALEGVRPHLQMEKGDVKFVEIEENGIVKVRLKGACAVCSMSQMTIKWDVESYLKKKLPEVKSVKAI